MHDDEDDDRPRSRRRPRDEDEDDTPRSRRRARDDDDEDDDRPSRRGGRGQPKKNALPLILGILGGVLLLCGGGCAGAYFGFLKPAAERAKALNDAKQQELDELMRREQEAMTRANARPGPQKPADPNTAGDPVPVATLTADELVANVARYRGKVVVVTGTVDKFGTGDGIHGLGGMTLRGGKNRTPINCSFDRSFSATPPKFDDRVEIRGEVAAASNDVQVQLFKCALTKPPTAGKPAEAPPAPPKPPADDKVIEVTAADLLAEYARDEKAAHAKYRAKTIKVTGDVKQATANQVVLAGKADGGFEYQVLVYPSAELRAGVGELKAGDKVTIVGRVALLTTARQKTKSLVVNDGKLAK